MGDKIIKYKKKEVTSSGKRRPVGTIVKKGKGSPNKNQKSKSSKPNQASTKEEKEKVSFEKPEDEGDFGDPKFYDNYFQVICAECKAEIAVYDRDEVYHFYDVTC